MRTAPFSRMLDYLRHNSVTAITFLLVILMAYFSGKAIVDNPGMSISGWLFAIAPVAVIGAAIVVITMGFPSGHNLGAFLELQSVQNYRGLFWIFLPIAAALSLVVVFDPFDLIVSGFVSIVTVLFLLSLYLLIRNQAIDALGLILLCLPFITYSEFEISRVFEISSAWITLKIAVILVFSFFWFISTFLICRKKPVRSRFNSLLLVFVLATLVSSLFSSDVSHSLSRWLFEIIYPIMFYFIVLNSIGCSADIRRFMFYLIAGVVLNLIIVLYYFTKYGVGNFALNSLFLNVNFADGMLIANILIMIIPVIIALITSANSAKIRLPLILAMILGFVGLVLSFGRMAQASMAIGLLAFGFLKRARKYTLFAVVIMLFFVFDSEIMKPYLSKYQDMVSIQDVLHASSLEKRFGGWEGALGMFNDHPLTGVGIGRYIDEYPDYASQYYAAYAGGYVSMISAHNIFLNYLAETGMPGFLILVTIFIDIVRRGIQLLKEGKQDYSFKFSLLISVLVFLINNLFDGITFAYVKEIDKGLVFWSIAAVIISYNMVNKKSIMTFRKNIRAENQTPSK